MKTLQDLVNQLNIIDESNIDRGIPVFMPCTISIKKKNTPNSGYGQWAVSKSYETLNDTFVIHSTGDPEIFNLSAEIIKDTVSNHIFYLKDTLGEEFKLLFFQLSPVQFSV